MEARERLGKGRSIPFSRHPYGKLHCLSGVSWACSTNIRFFMSLCGWVPDAREASLRDNCLGKLCTSDTMMLLMFLPVWPEPIQSLSGEQPKRTCQGKE